MEEVVSDVLVVGGGVAGLCAAEELRRVGLSVALVEARDRLGGRIHTVHPAGWIAPVELGAEFIHKGNTQFWKRFRSLGLTRRRVPEAHWRFDGATLLRIRDLAAEIKQVTRRIDDGRMAGWSFADFLRHEGRRLGCEQRQLATDYVEGFQAAPAENMSAVAVAGETLEPAEQFLPSGGYGGLVRGLAAQLDRGGVKPHLATIVRRIEWERGQVRTHARRARFISRAAVITVPLGVLKARSAQRGTINFAPALGRKAEVIARMQFGQVIRLTLRLDRRSWQRMVPAALQRARGGFGFVHARCDDIRVWWALGPHPVVTGWAGGPAAIKLGRETGGRRVCDRALGSLAAIFGVSQAVLRTGIADCQFHDWARDPFSRGAYTFIAAGQEDASEELRSPLADTLFFAGEATADQGEIGTVHGAFSSGLRVAAEVRRTLGG